MACPCVSPKSRESREFRVDLIVIGIGGNDAFELSTPKKWIKDVRELIKSLRVKFENVPILFIHMPLIKEFPAFTSLIKFTIGNLVHIPGDELEKIVKDFEKSLLLCLKGYL